jgi:hypothetical protein
MNRLRLPKKTFYRYLKQTFEDDIKVLDKLDEDEIMTQFVILRDRFNLMYREAKEISRDKEVDAQVRLSAMNLAADAAISYVKLLRESPTRQIANNELSIQPNSLPQPQQQSSSST